MNSALQKNLRCDHIEAVGFPSMIHGSIQLQNYSLQKLARLVTSDRENKP